MRSIDCTCHLIALWSYAQTNGIAGSNPWRVLKPARVCNKPKTIPEADFERALGFLEANPKRFNPFRFWRCLYLTLAFTGMRRAQLIGLVWEDVNLTTNTITLCSETSKTFQKYTIPISSQLCNCLIQLHADAKALWNGAPNFNTSQVFNVDLHKLTEKASQTSMIEDQVSRFFTKLARLSEASLSCHRMRHHMTIRLLENNATHARNVQALLGHTNVATTLLYVSPNVGEIRRALYAL
jgi:integrase